MESKYRKVVMRIVRVLWHLVSGVPGQAWFSGQRNAHSHVISASEDPEYPQNDKTHMYVFMLPVCDEGSGFDIVAGAVSQVFKSAVLPPWEA